MVKSLTAITLFALLCLFLSVDARQHPRGPARNAPLIKKAGTPIDKRATPTTSSASAAATTDAWTNFSQFDWATWTSWGFNGHTLSYVKYSMVSRLLWWNQSATGSVFVAGVVLLRLVLRNVFGSADC
ncbi:hypothetical protein P7C73_g3427, partial [Tremellales sp. Uapishka_1]